jgi:hypothetical protein
VRLHLKVAAAIACTDLSLLRQQLGKFVINVQKATTGKDAEVAWDTTNADTMEIAGKAREMCPALGCRVDKLEKTMTILFLLPCPWSCASVCWDRPHRHEQQKHADADRRHQNQIAGGFHFLFPSTT